MAIKCTKHALERYLERINPKSERTKKELSKIIVDKVEKALIRSQPLERIFENLKKEDKGIDINISILDNNWQELRAIVRKDRQGQGSVITSIFERGDTDWRKYSPLFYSGKED